MDIGAESINLSKNGDIAITVFSSATFNAAAIDVGSVRFIGALAVKSDLVDVNKDGQLDLVLHFNIADTNLVALYQQQLLADYQADGTVDSTKQQTTLLLSGLTTSGLFWGGLDSVKLFESGQALTDLLVALGLK